MFVCEVLTRGELNARMTSIVKPRQWRKEARPRGPTLCTQSRDAETKSLQRTGKYSFETAPPSKVRIAASLFLNYLIHNVASFSANNVNSFMIIIETFTHPIHFFMFGMRKRGK